MILERLGVMNVSQMQNIYKEYSRMRQSGMDAKSVLNALRPRIESLSKPEREVLAGKLRAWEARPSTQEMRAVPAAKPPQPEAPKPAPIKPITPTGAKTTPGTAEKEIVWVVCGHCGKANQKHEVVCYSCGQLLDGGKGPTETRNLNLPDSSPLDSEYFGPDSVLALRVRGSTDPYEVRPQKGEEIIVGRNTSNSAMAPDIDLGTKQGADLGVSRLHLSIRYDAENKAVLVSDLGSANGSFINGQRLLAKEVRVLRHSDELRLGKMVMIVSFRHPNVAP
jgi:hypothetical protein